MTSQIFSDDDNDDNPQVDLEQGFALLQQLRQEEMMLSSVSFSSFIDTTTRLPQHSDISTNHQLPKNHQLPTAMKRKLLMEKSSPPQVSSNTTIFNEGLFIPSKRHESDPSIQQNSHSQNRHSDVLSSYHLLAAENDPNVVNTNNSMTLSLLQQPSHHIQHQSIHPPPPDRPSDRRPPDRPSDRRPPDRPSDRRPPDRPSDDLHHPNGVVNASLEQTTTRAISAIPPSPFSPPQMTTATDSMDETTIISQFQQQLASRQRTLETLKAQYRNLIAQSLTQSCVLFDKDIVRHCIASQCQQYHIIVLKMQQKYLTLNRILSFVNVPSVTTQSNVSLSPKIDHINISSLLVDIPQMNQAMDVLQQAYHRYLVNECQNCLQIMFQLRKQRLQLQFKMKWYDHITTQQIVMIRIAEQCYNPYISQQMMSSVSQQIPCVSQQQLDISHNMSSSLHWLVERFQQVVGNHHSDDDETTDHHVEMIIPKIITQILNIQTLLQVQNVRQYNALTTSDHTRATNIAQKQHTIHVLSSIDILSKDYQQCKKKHNLIVSKLLKTLRNSDIVSSPMDIFQDESFLEMKLQSDRYIEQLKTYQEQLNRLIHDDQMIATAGGVVQKRQSDEFFKSAQNGIISILTFDELQYEQWRLLAEITCRQRQNGLIG